MKILITGGSGQVGKELQKIMPDCTYISSKDYDLTIEKEVIKLMCSNDFDVVIHLAAKVGGIIDNIENPETYFLNNILMNTYMVKWSRLTGVKHFLGILSTCIFPDIVENYPMTEKDLHLGPPTNTNFSYGYAKRCLAVHIDASNKQYGTNYNYISPCNLYGEHDKIGNNSHFLSALIQKIIETEKNDTKTLNLFGTGKPLRQFMYAKDFAKIIKKIVEEEKYENFNVACRELYSIDEMARIALNVTNHTDWVIEYDKTKPDGQYRKDVSIEKFDTIFPNHEFTKLKDGIKKVYEYYKYERK